MPGSVIQKSLNYGYEGSISRNTPFEVLSMPVDETSDNIPFGYAIMKTADSTFKLADATTTAANFVGLATNEVRQNNNYPYAPVAAPPPNFFPPLAQGDALVMGIMTVKCRRGTPSPLAGVYLRIAANVAYPNTVVGGLEATADGSNTVQLTNAKWVTNRIDANGITEVRLQYAN